MRTRRRVFETKAEADRFMPKNGQLFMVKEGNQLRVGYNDVRGGWYQEGQPVFDLGFGPQIPIKGDINLGYFGEIAGADLFTRDQLIQANGLTQGTPSPTEIDWLKIVYQEKVLFVAKKWVSRELSWDDLYASGSVYKDNTDAPSLQQPEVVDQDLSLTRDGYTFKLRLMTTEEYGAIIGGLTDGTLASLTFSGLGLITTPNKYDADWGSSSDGVRYPHRLGLRYDDLDTRKWVYDPHAFVNVMSVLSNFSNTNTGLVIYHNWRPVLELVHDINLIPELD